MNLKSFEVRPRSWRAGARSSSDPPAILRQELRVEWDVITTSHHNVLLVGRSQTIRTLLHALEPHLRQPIVEFAVKAGEPLPEPNQGALILLEIAELDAAQQLQMLRWLHHLPTRVQVVCTSSRPIYSLVQAGGFLTELYYRLNVVRLDLTPSGDRS